LNVQNERFLKKMEQISEKEILLEEKENSIQKKMRELELKEEKLNSDKQSQLDDGKKEMILEDSIGYEIHNNGDEKLSFLQRFKELREECNKFELENSEIKLILAKREEEMEILQIKQVDLENDLDFLKEEVTSKNEQITTVSKKLKDITRIIDNKYSGSKIITDLENELDKMRLALQAHQTQCSFMNQMIQRVTDEKRTEVNAKKKNNRII